MKTKLFKSIFFIGLFLIMFLPNECFGQESIDQKARMLDLKLELLDSKLELLDSKIKLWESKPKELDIRLHELDSKIKSMDFEPVVLNSKLQEIDSIVKVLQETEIPFEIHEQVVYDPEMPFEIHEQVIYEPESEFMPEYKSAIMLDPLRLMEGTFHISYERIINDKFSINVSGMGTYATEQGISSLYFANQALSYFDKITNAYRTYEGEVMAGGGLSVQVRNYLLENYNPKQKAPAGLYAAPQLMYRRMWITGNYMEYEEEEDEWVEKEITQHLNVFAGGVILGIKLPVMKVLTVDLFVGGNIRLSKYNDEKGFTKYKDWFNIDFSGVFPTAGIGIGILK